MASCRKSGNDVDIKTYDTNQIKDYIAANGLSAMKRDTVGGDTSGIYYQITRPGHGAALNYDTRISFSYTIKSLDGRYAVTDTITARSYNAVGLIAPKGLMMVIHDVVKNKGTSARFLIPSRLGYGVSGSGVGTSRLPGNASLDYTVNILDNDNTAAMAAYDDLSIRNYCAANNINISSYTKKASGLYIRVTQAGTGTTAVTSTSTVNVQYLGYLLNNNVFGQYDDQSSTNVGTALNMPDLVAGFQEGLLGLTGGAKVDLLIPSNLAYGSLVRNTTNAAGQTVVSIPTYSCLRYGINLVSVTN
ncbi:FKBP-type peptidyl-prolyl cis-trans isomerase [Mucilaginibacter sp. CSA2-8R]|uniref:FKBP-type peptidyl-prolyl cis-trans isomerase n=1 Tax=Mucilaginibacter sp. CSA2-8R TaxID=3141542 RepID=UPI00315D45C0